MPNKGVLILVSLFAAIAVISLYSYSYVFLDVQVASIINASHAPTNYRRLILHQPTQALNLSYSENNEIIVQPATLKTWLETYHRDYTRTEDLRLNSETLSTYLNNLALKINQPPVNARLDYKNGKIVEFAFPQKGQVISNTKTSASILNALLGGKVETELVFDEVEPQITLGQIENLGIKKLLGRGESNFGGSSQARINNIRVASRLYNGLILKPGEEFSFNNILGDVDATNGYLPELVIKKTGLIKEYGGGICQVATTMFRAAIFSGLKILERRPHSFPVKYYNPQGFDATIYPGQADLRFLNDTGNNIIVQTRIIGTKIFFEFYGNDDRDIAVATPTQYDIKSDGSMRAIFSRIIKSASGQTTKEEFKSSYKSPTLFPTLRNPLE